MTTPPPLGPDGQPPGAPRQGGPGPSWTGDATGAGPTPYPSEPLPPTTRPAQNASSFACVSCGAHLTHLPGTLEMRCPYCGTQQPVPQVGPGGGTIGEHDYEEWLRSPDKPRGFTAGHVVACPRCGAQQTVDDISRPCSFCSAPIVVEIDPAEQVVPEGIVPFGLDRRAAVEAMRAWTGSRWFAPNGLKKVTAAERINGTYVPHWTYDARTETRYSGMRGDHYFVQVSYTDGEGRQQTRTEQRTRWWPASGVVARDFDDVLVIGSTRLAPDEVSKLEPWTMDGAQAYQQGFLSGYTTLRYDIEPEQGLGVAKERMRAVIADDVRRDIGGDVQQIHGMDTGYRDLHFKLMLLPVWVAGYLYGGKTYTVYINAHDGHVVGERPYSVPKIVAAVVAALLLLGTLWFFVGRGQSTEPTAPTPRVTTPYVSVTPHPGTPSPSVPVTPGAPTPTGGPTYWTG